MCINRFNAPCLIKLDNACKKRIAIFYGLMSLFWQCKGFKLHTELCVDDICFVLS